MSVKMEMVAVLLNIICNGFGVRSDGNLPFLET